MAKDKVYEKLLEHDRQFKTVDKKLADHDKQFEKIDQQFERIDKRFEGMDKRFEGMDKRFDGIDKRFEEVDKQFVEVKEDIKDFRGAVMEALDHLVVTTDRIDRERLVASHQIKNLRDRVDGHDQEISKLKAQSG